MKNGTKEITVTFNTLTPLWTGNAWGECKEIKPSSLIGSLRFWFAFYWKVIKKQNTEKLNSNGLPVENLNELIRKKGGTFKNILIDKLQETNCLDQAIDSSLDELGLSVPSRIFGCTGWKSRVKINIESFSTRKIKFEDIDFEFPLNLLSLNSRFWIRKILFNNNIDKPIKLFENVKVKLITTNHWWNKYLKDFFEFFKDKIILVGGKNSFGFGFVSLNIGNNIHDSYSSINNKLRIERISQIPYTNDKEVLGFNFKYYLRKQEEAKFRKKNFGSQGESSRIYVSNLLEDKTIYLLMLNNPFLDQSSIPAAIINNYIEKLGSLEKGEPNES